MSGKIALITGGSSGIGRCTAVSLKKMGCKVYEMSRRDIPCDGIIHLTADGNRRKCCEICCGKHNKF